jgi:hypothetical protein
MFLRQERLQIVRTLGWALCPPNQPQLRGRHLVRGTPNEILFYERGIIQCLPIQVISSYIMSQHPIKRLVPRSILYIKYDSQPSKSLPKSPLLPIPQPLTAILLAAPRTPTQRYLPCQPIYPPVRQSSGNVEVDAGRYRMVAACRSSRVPASSPSTRTHYP